MTGKKHIVLFNSLSLGRFLLPRDPTFSKVSGNSPGGMVA